MDGRGNRIPFANAVGRVPQSFNPKQGFIQSANQKIAPPGYPDYLGWDYEPPFRGMMIRRTLTSKEKLSPEDMIQLQNENLDVQAEMVLPRSCVWPLKARIKFGWGVYANGITGLGQNKPRLRSLRRGGTKLKCRCSPMIWAKKLKNFFRRMPECLDA